MLLIEDVGEEEVEELAEVDQVPEEVCTYVHVHCNF